MSALLVLALGLVSAFGHSCAAIGDVDRDGCADLAIEDGTGVWLASGRDGRFLAFVEVPPDVVTWGRTLLALDDLDGDGARDLLVWGRSPDRFQCAAYSTIGGALLFALALPTSSPFGQAAPVLVDDRDGDGLRDLAWLVGSRSDDAWVLSLRSTRDGRELEARELVLGAMRASSLFECRDLDADGVADWIVGGTTSRASGERAFAALIRGRTGLPLRVETGRAGGGALHGRLVQLGDLDGDRVPDVACALAAPWKGENGFGAIEVCSGASLAPLCVVPLLEGGTSVRGAAPLGDLDGDGSPEIGLVSGDLVEELTVLSPKAGVLFHFASGSETGGFGHALGAAGDVDGDGADDVWISDQRWEDELVGVVHIVGGRTRKLLRTLESPTTGRFGAAVFAFDDLDGDGVRELGIGDPGAQSNGPESGRLWILSGRTSSVLFHVDGRGANERVGLAAASIGDVDGDGRPDLVLGARGASDHAGAVRVVSGRDGRELRAIAGSAHDSVGFEVRACGDWDRDGLADFAVSAPGRDEQRGAVEVRSARSGKVVARLDGTRAHGQLGTTLVASVERDGSMLVLTSGTLLGDGAERLLGLRSSAPEARLDVGATKRFAGRTGTSFRVTDDLDGDGALDLALLGMPIAPSDVPGSVGVFGSRARSLVFRIDGELEVDHQAFTCVEITSDLDLDGVRDLVVGDAGAYVPREDDASSTTRDRIPGGRVRAHSGADGHELWRAWGTPGEDFGASAATIGDIDGDGTPDIAVGATRVDASRTANAVIVLSGADGSRLRRIERRGESIAASQIALSTTPR